MTPRTLRRNWQFRVCYNHGRKIVCDHAVIFYHYVSNDEGRSPEAVQIGVVASKRVGNAVRRNRAKRLLREAARSVAAKLNDRNLWIVLIAKASIADATSAEIRAEIDRGLKKAGVISRDT